MTTEPLTTDELSALADDEGVQPAGLGARAAREIEHLRKIAAVANLVGQHLRDQDGVNAAHLDELAAVTSPDGKWDRVPAVTGPVTVSHFRITSVERPTHGDVRMLDVSKLSEYERKAPIVGDAAELSAIPLIPNVWPGMRVLWNGREWTVAMVDGNPRAGRFAVEFVERADGDEVMLRAAPEFVPPAPSDGWQNLEPRSFYGVRPHAKYTPEQVEQMRRMAAAGESVFLIQHPQLLGVDVKVTGSDGELMSAFREFHQSQAKAMDDAVHLAMSFGFPMRELEIVRQYVSELGERTVLTARGVEIFELVATSPGMPQPNDAGDHVTVTMTVTPRWLIELAPVKR